MRTEPIPKRDLEESAQGHTHFRAPGVEVFRSDAREEAAEWLLGEPPAHGSAVDPRITRRRRDLYEAMERLEASVARPSGIPGWAVLVDGSLRELEDALIRHVSETEGPDGFLEEIIAGSPHLAAAVDDLRRDHAQLIASCSIARDTLANEESDPAAVRRQIVAILGRLVFHRHKGAELVYDAYNIDISVGN